MHKIIDRQDTFHLQEPLAPGALDELYVSYYSGMLHADAGTTKAQYIVGETLSLLNVEVYTALHYLCR